MKNTIRTKYIMLATALAISLGSSNVCQGMDISPAPTPTDAYLLKIGDSTAIKINNNKFTHTERTQVNRGTVLSEHGDGPVIEFWDNGKDKLLILGAGFPDGKEAMQPWVSALSNEYDIATFNYKPINTFHVTHVLLHQRCDDIKKIVAALKAKKTYTSIIGLGLCYSAYIFAKTQATTSIDNPLFDKLILDSCIFSVSAMAHVSPSGWFHHNYKEQDSYIKTAGLTLAEKVLYIPWALPYYSGFFDRIEHYAAEVPITNSLADIDIPVLFVHAFDDRLVPIRLAEEMYSAVPTTTKKYLLSTPPPHKHARNLSRVYVSMVKDFIDGINHFFEETPISI